MFLDIILPLTLFKKMFFVNAGPDREKEKGGKERIRTCKQGIQKRENGNDCSVKTQTEKTENQLPHL